MKKDNSEQQQKEKLKNTMYETVNPHEKINQGLTDINHCLTNIFKI